MTNHTHQGETVVALFHSKFSHKLLPGATHEDMEQIHRMSFAHHNDILGGLRKQYANTDDGKQLNDLHKQMKFHAAKAAKHKNRAEFFHNTNPNNAKIASPTPAVAPKAVTPTTNETPVKPATKPENTVPNSTKLPSTNLSDKFKPIAHAISKGAAKVWHSLAPKAKAWFAKKRPESPLSKSHLTGEPKMPMSPKAIHDAHIQQFHFHQKETAKAQAKLESAPVPEVKQTAAKKMKEEKGLANTHLALAQKAIAPKIPEPSKEAPKALAKPKAPVKKAANKSRASD